ncbi:hypothetical protein [Empedobacter brevis]|uniref:hypothetical protein n=1 Tax=Empedobacter brevis TaxID=247 RepID=UPI0028981B1E|nr:hypothetical protein [Empedobacter brevis]
MKKEWWILLAVILLPLLGLFSYIGYITFSDKRTNKEVFLDFVKQDIIHGQIELIYYQTKNHNQYTVATKNELIVLPQNWEHKFLIGDSLSKDSGSLKLEHYRDGKLLEVLDYNDIYIREGW